MIWKHHIKMTNLKLDFFFENKNDLTINFRRNWKTSINTIFKRFVDECWLNLIEMTKEIKLNY
jgi:hypothetical protein